MNNYSESILRERALAAETGGLRERIRFDLEPRAPYAFGLLAAADAARFFGFTQVTAIEFGVAEGGGLTDMCMLAAQVTRATGVGFRIFGFDTGAGLPAPKDYRDHPEIWSQGDFAIASRTALEQRLPAEANMVWGDVAATLGPFMAGLAPSAPLGFVAHDFDVYGSTVDALRLYAARAELLLPVSIAYFDDTLGNPARIGSLMRNRWAGQLRAIDEFNAGNEHRKIDHIRTLKYRRPLNQEQWLEQIYAVHALDHPARNGPGLRAALSMDAHVAAGMLEWPL